MLQDLPSESSELPGHDELLANSIRDRLSATGYQELRRRDVAVEDGHVQLSGRVPRYYLMQLAQKAAMDAEGVLELRNGTQVVKR